MSTTVIRLNPAGKSPTTIHAYACKPEIGTNPDFRRCDATRRARRFDAGIGGAPGVKTFNTKESASSQAPAIEPQAPSAIPMPTTLAHDLATPTG